MANYLYCEGMVIELGQLFDPRTPSDGKTNTGYLEWSSRNTVPDNSPIGVEVKVDSKAVSTEKELFEFMKVDIALTAKFGLSNMNFQMSWEREIKGDERTLIYIIGASKKYSTETISGVCRLSDIGKEFWLDSDSESEILNFQRTVGTEYVNSITRGNLLYAVYKFTGSTSSFKQTLAAKLDGRWSTGNVSTDLYTEMSEIDKSIVLSTQLFQSGIIANNRDYPQLASILKLEPGNFKDINNLIASILETSSRQEANISKILSFTTAKVGDIYDVAKVSTKKITYDKFEQLNRMRDTLSNQLYDVLKDTLIKKVLVEDLIAKYNIRYFKEDSLDKLKTNLESIRSKLIQLTSQYESITQAKSETDFNIKIEEVSLISLGQVLLELYVQCLGWDISYVHKPISSTTGQFYVLFFPRLNIRHPEWIDSIQLIHNETINGNRKQDVFIYNQDQIMDISKDPSSVKLGKKYPETITLPVYDNPHIDAAFKALKSKYITQEANSDNKLIIFLKDGTQGTLNIQNISTFNLPNIPAENFMFL